MLGQLLARSETIAKEFLECYANAARYGRTSFSNSDRPFELLRKVATGLPNLYLVLDGLDEFEEPSVVADAFINLAASTNMRVVCFSRDITSLRSLLGTTPNIRLDTTLMKPDIDRYFDSAINGLPDIDDANRKDLLEKLSAGAKGMFLWAHLMIQNLSSATNPMDLSNALNELPLGLNNTYDHILKGLSKEAPTRRRLARHLFLWMCCCARPMTLRELEDALSWETEDGIFQITRKPFTSTLIGACCPLIEHHEVDNTLALVHSSVRDFLCATLQASHDPSESDQFLVRVGDGHEVITEICLDYLSLPDLINTVDVDEGHFPLAQYATMYWCHHLLRVDPSERVYKKARQFTSDRLARRTWIMRFMLSKRSAFPLQQLVKLQKLVQDWMQKVGNGNDTYALDDIDDLQHFIFDSAGCDSSLEGLETGRLRFQGISNFERLLTIRDLAREYSRRGRLDDGISWLARCLARVESLRGHDSIDSTWLLNSLGILYDQQSKADLAAHTQKRALAIQEAQLPHDHLDTTLTVNELGRVYRHLGQYEKSEAMHLRALETLQKSLPDDDLQVIWTLNTLGRNYVKQYRTDEAIKLHEKALEGQQRILGKEHPHALWTMTDIARCLCAQGDFTDALAMQEKVVEVRSRVLGTHHADTLWSMNSVALVLEDLGRQDEAKTWHRKALEGQRVYLRNDHEHTKWTRSALERLS